MKRRYKLLVVLSAVCWMGAMPKPATPEPSGAATPAQDASPAGSSPAGSSPAGSSDVAADTGAETGAGKRLIVVPIDGVIELGLASFVERVISGADENDVILLRIKTFGGRVDAAVRIRDALLDAPGTTIAYVDRRAISAGALISLAADTIIMSKGASIGAATPVQQGSGGEMKATSEKVVSYMRAEMRATAEAKGRRADIAEAMVDADVEIEGISAKGKLLTLTGTKAVEFKLAQAVVSNLEEALVLLNLQDAEQIDSTTHWAEKLARVLTNPTISSMLMTFGFLGLLLELYTPGFGVGGTIGVTCLALFFLGQYAAHLAGWEELLLFALGAGLLALEVFVIPGFGIAGIAGIVLLGVAVVMSMLEVHVPLDVSFELGYVQEAVSEALVQVSLVTVLLVIAVIWMSKVLPRSSFGKWLVFDVRRGRGVGAAGQSPLGAEAPGGSLEADLSLLVGQKGKAHTVLRPTGIVEFSGRRVHVSADGEFIDQGATVEVMSVDGHRVVVRGVST